MDRLIEKLARPSGRHDDVTSSSAALSPEPGSTFLSTASSAPNQSYNPASEAEHDEQLGLFQLWPLKSEGYEVEKTQVE